MRGLAEIERDNALATVERHGTEAEILRLRRAIHNCARTLPDGFTTDDVWAVIHPWRPREPRLLGAVIKVEARALGLAPDGWVRSGRAECHARPVQVWRRKG